MSPKFTSCTYERLIPDLRAAIDWFEHLGIGVRGTRLGRYRKLLDEILELQETLDYEQATRKFPDYLNTLYSAHEIALIYRGFAGRGYDTLVRDRLRKVAAGPEHHTAELRAMSNEARTAAFELIVGSYLAKAGFRLLGGSIADLVAVVKDRPVVFECKRPQGERGFAANLHKAHSQLMIRYVTAGLSHSRGVIAIDVSKAMNDQFRLFRSMTHADVVMATTSLLNSCIDRYCRHLSRLTHPKTLAVILRFSAMAEIGDTATNLVYHQHFGFVELSSATIRNTVLIEDLRAVFE
jgi:hypothetical protein